MAYLESGVQPDAHPPVVFELLFCSGMTGLHVKGMLVKLLDGGIPATTIVYVT